MLTGQQIRHRILDGLETGRLWQLAYDYAKLRGETDGGMPCHVCDQTIPRGQVYALVRSSVVVLVHLECYLFWLHASGLFEPQPVTGTCCRRLIPRHAERTVVDGAPYHERCWERLLDRRPPLATRREGSDRR